jgi:hypothetical protein
MGMNFEKHAWWQLHDLQIKFPFVVPSRLDVVQDLVFVLWVFGKGFIQSRRPVDAKIFAVFFPNTDIRVKSGFVNDSADTGKGLGIIDFMDRALVEFGGKLGGILAVGALVVIVDDVLHFFRIEMGDVIKWNGVHDVVSGDLFY